MKDTDPPVIAVTPDLSVCPPLPLPQEQILFLARRYTDALLSCGALPWVLPPRLPPPALTRLFQRIDGLLVTGGNFDVHPRLYGEEPGTALGEIKSERTEGELALIRLALERDVPLLGICGGEQAINVALGGSLYQDIRTQLPDALEHELGSARACGGHPIRVAAGTRLHAIVRQEVLDVNTTHHQSVKKLGRGLTVNATTADGVIEGIESLEHRFVLGVQWHPELLLANEHAQQIFAAFVAASRSLSSARRNDT